MAEATQIEITLDEALQELDGQTLKFPESEQYYNAEKRDIAIGIATPPQLRSLLAQVGVPRIYVDSLVERLIVEGFRRGDSSEADDELWGWYKANSLDSSQALLYKDCLVLGRGYVTVAAPEELDASDPDPMRVEDVPIIRVESPKSLFAKIDPRTKRIEWAVRKVTNSDGDVVAATLYFRDRTEIYEYVEGEPQLTNTVSHGLGVVPVVPFTNASSADDAYGTSIISDDIKSVTDAMSRALMNLQTTSELMATPQRMIFGSTVDELQGDAETALELYTSSYIVVEDPTAKAMSLPAAELRNFVESMSHMMKLAASYTGLPPQYLAFSGDNPASAEAIRSSEARLVRHCESLTVMLGEAWEQVMRVALLVMGNQLTIDDFRMETVWRDPSTPTVAAKADAASKLYNSGNGVIPKQQARLDMGYTPEQIRQMEDWDLQTPVAQAAAMYGTQGVTNEPGATGDQNVPDNSAGGDSVPDGA